MGLDAIIQFLKDIWDFLKPIVFVKEYELAYQFRAGNALKAWAPGPHFKIPFLDDFHLFYAKDDTIKTPSQKLTTKDKKIITISGNVLYYIDGLEGVTQFAIAVNNPLQAISDMTEVAIARNVVNTNYEDCTNEMLMNEVTKDVRRDCKKWGVKILEVTITNCALSRSLNLFNETPAHL